MPHLALASQVSPTGRWLPLSLCLWKPRGSWPVLSTLTSCFLMIAPSNRSHRCYVHEVHSRNQSGYASQTLCWENQPHIKDYAVYASIYTKLKSSKTNAWWWNSGNPCRFLTGRVGERAFQGVHRCRNHDVVTGCAVRFHFIKIQRATCLWSLHFSVYVLYFN